MTPAGLHLWPVRGPAPRQSKQGPASNPPSFRSARDNQACYGHWSGAVTCATYNFETTSQMWAVLKEAPEQPGVVVTVYVDGDKVEAAKVKAQLLRATIYQ